MKALVYTDTLEMEYRDEPKPVPGPGEALVAQTAAGLNFIMALTRGVCLH